jgi:hypothetical protein
LGIVVKDMQKAHPVIVRLEWVIFFTLYCAENHVKYFMQVSLWA